MIVNAGQAFASLDEYFGHVERSWRSAAQVFVSLPKDIKRAVREDVRRAIDRPVSVSDVEVEFMFAGGLN